MNEVREERLGQCFPHPLERYWLGFCQFRKTKTKRKAVQIRSSIGITHYRLWTEPDKGKQYISVMQFEKIKKLSKEQVDRRFNTL